MYVRLTIAGLLLAGPQLVSAGFYSTNVTTLMRGAIQGQNVATPVPGASLLLMKDGQVIYHQAFGVTFLNDIHQVDSSTKALSGAAFLSLTDSAPSPFSLDTTLATYVPGFNATADKAGITVRQAFSHSSGLPGSETGGGLGNPNITLQQSAAQISSLPLAFGPPGSNFAYGGLSMQAAGAAGEVAAGVPWTQLVGDRILSPLGMNSTHYTIASETNPRIAGGAASTGRDFAQLMEMLRGGGVSRTGQRVLSQAAVDQMFTRQTAGDITLQNSPLNSVDYGIGVWLDRRDSTGNLEQALASGARGFSSWIDFPNGVVGVFATDSTSAQNIVPFLDLMRDEVDLQVNTMVLDGDTNLSNNVDLDDFSTLAANFGRGQRLWEQGDFTGDGFVTLNDFTTLATHFGQATTRAPTTVPEPACLTVVLATTATLFRQKKGSRH